MKKRIMFLIGLIIFSLSSCKKSDVNPSTPEEEKETKVYNTITLESGKIDEPTTWKSGNVYVIDGKTLRIESVLTLEAGAVVKLKNARIDVVGGKIIAKGNANDRIVFTSLADDRFAGDTNGDGNASKPAKGDWIQIYLNSTTESIFQYVDIFYSGKNSGGSNNAVRVSGRNAILFTFDNCRIAHTMYTESSYDSSCAFYGSGDMSDSKTSIFTNNALFDNGKPLYLNAYYNLASSNKFHNPEKPSETNTHNGIFMSTSGLDRTGNWTNTEVAYVLDAKLHAYGATTINIGPKVVVKFKNPSSGLQRSLEQNIKMDKTAILTSFKDDAHAGDTNGDG